MANVSITAENITQLRSLQRGDHIAVEEGILGIKYYHHGIFLGHHKGVADVGFTNKMAITVRILDILEFTDQGKRKLIRYIYQGSECLPAEDAAINAEDLAKNPKLWGRYDFLLNNSEHFAARCKVRAVSSFQVINKLRDALPAIAGVAIISLFSPAVAIGCAAVGGILLANKMSK